jgi:hypothetical protein
VENYGNKPFILGGIADVANAITVGATSTDPYERMAPFSARGPGVLNNLKPDMSAPGERMVFAKAGSGGGGVSSRGTSFASPIVAGAAAVLLQKCPECSSFAIKSILMNNARRLIKDNKHTHLNAPISWVGSGEVNLTKAVEASFWAYSVDDTQPSIGLGLLDVTSDMLIRRTILLTSLSIQPQRIQVHAAFRDPNDRESAAMKIDIKSTDFILSNQSIQRIDIEFQIKASRVPSNYMTSGGTDGMDPRFLDKNEVDGWIVMTAEGNEAHIPFHAILRKAADVTVGVQQLPIQQIFSPKLDIQLKNSGTGVAQIDAYELLATSEDDEEPLQLTRSLSPPADFRYIGYRTVPGEQCNYVLEFAFQLWERQQTLANTELRVLIDVDGDAKQDFVLANRGPRFNDATASECRIQNVKSGEWACANFPPDHATNSATVIIRVCSNDIGIKPYDTIGVSFSSATYPRLSQQVDSSPYMQVSVPSAISSPSINLYPGALLSDLRVLAGSTSVKNPYAKGLLIVTNSYRNRQSTGAATPTSEAIAIPFPGVSLPAERTPDNLSFPRASSVRGPGSGWDASTGKCAATRRIARLELDKEVLWNGGQDYLDDRYLAEETCTENRVPRIFQENWLPTAVPTNFPSFPPTFRPTSSPLPPPMVAPTLYPSDGGPGDDDDNDDTNETPGISAINSAGETSIQDGGSEATSGESMNRALQFIILQSVILAFFLL